MKLKRSLVSATVAGALLLSGAASAMASPAQAFMDGCTGAGGTISQCTCALTEIENYYTPAQVVAVFGNGLSNAPAADRILIASITLDCLDGWN